MALKAMETTKLVGLRALIKASGCPETGIASDNIGFGLAPRLNAVGRLEHAQLAVELLVTDDSVKAEKIAAELNRENTLRQEISRQIMEEAEAQLAQEKHIDTAIVLASEGWHPGRYRYRGFTPGRQVPSADDSDKPEQRRCQGQLPQYSGAQSLRGDRCRT